MKIKRTIVNLLCIALVLGLIPLSSTQTDRASASDSIQVTSQAELIEAINADTYYSITIISDIELSEELLIENKGLGAGPVRLNVAANISADLENAIRIKNSKVVVTGSENKSITNTGRVFTVEGKTQDLGETVTDSDYEYASLSIVPGFNGHGFTVKSKRSNAILMRGYGPNVNIRRVRIISEGEEATIAEDMAVPSLEAPNDKLTIYGGSKIANLGSGPAIYFANHAGIIISALELGYDIATIKGSTAIEISNSPGIVFQAPANIEASSSTFLVKNKEDLEKDQYENYVYEPMTKGTAIALYPKADGIQAPQIVCNRDNWPEEDSVFNNGFSCSNIDGKVGLLIANPFELDSVAVNRMQAKFYKTHLEGPVYNLANIDGSKLLLKDGRFRKDGNINCNVSETSSSLYNLTIGDKHYGLDGKCTEYQETRKLKSGASLELILSSYSESRLTIVAPDITVKNSSRRSLIKLNYYGENGQFLEKTIQAGEEFKTPQYIRKENVVDFAQEGLGGTKLTFPKSIDMNKYQIYLEEIDIPKIGSLRESVEAKIAFNIRAKNRESGDLVDLQDLIGPLQDDKYMVLQWDCEHNNYGPSWRPVFLEKEGQQFVKTRRFYTTGPIVVGAKIFNSSLKFAKIGST